MFYKDHFLHLLKDFIELIAKRQHNVLIQNQTHPVLYIIIVDDPLCIDILIQKIIGYQVYGRFIFGKGVGYRGIPQEARILEIRSQNTVIGIIKIG